MSARKPLARMESPAITDSEVQSTKEDVKTEEINSKSVSIENGDKPSANNSQNEVKLKEEKLDTDETGSNTGSQQNSTGDGKRVTRNSPMHLASPLKKKLSDSQEQESSAESTSTTDEVPKKEKDKPPVPRARKHSDPSSKSTVPAPTNRLTRKAAAKNWAANTRLTRARRASCGIGAAPETPPKRKYVFKKNITDQPAAAAKRKRSVSPKPSADEPAAKVSKADDQDANFDMNTLTIKQEMLESSEEMASDVASDIIEPFPWDSTSRISLRTRKAMSYSPTTRTYRRGDKDKEKANTEASTSDGKRKRLSRVRLDEDSKDSLASSTMDEVVDIKVEEKFSSEDTNEAILPSTTTAVDSTTTATTTVDSATTTVTSTVDSTTTTTPTSTVDSTTTTSATITVANGTNVVDAETPLTVDTTESTLEKSPSIDTTDPINKAPILATTEEKEEAKSDAQVPSTSAVPNSEKSNSSDKATSLSPELVSEGVSEISVKQFYKKPEFMENNLGIEMDPKLGEIVQNVAEKMEDIADRTSMSNESLKEGELIFEDDDEIESIGEIKNQNEFDEDDDANSVSTGFISPLIVEEEDDDEDELQSVLIGNENIEETSNLNDETLEPDNKNETLVEVPDEVIESDEEKEEPSIESPTELKVADVEEVPPVNECNADKIVDTDETKVSSIKESVDDTVESKIKEVPETELSESCDKPESDMNIKIEDISTKVEDPEEEKPKLKEPKCVEKKEEISEHKEEAIDTMEVDEVKAEESKVEEPKVEDVIIDQEENKENMELGAESAKEDKEFTTQEVEKPLEKENVIPMSADEQEESASESSKLTSPSKIQSESSEEATTPSTSPQSSKSSSLPRTPENDEKLRQKERHLKTLGLLTHKAADEAIIAKQKRRKFLHNLSSKKNTHCSTGTNAASGNAQNKSAQEYTGTLKTVIKLNRQSGGGANDPPKKGKNTESGTGTKAASSGCGSRRQSLKMTFQKGRGRPSNTEKSGENPANTSGEDSYYTIQNEGEGAIPTTSAETTTSNMTSTTAHGRKSYNRSNTTDATHHTEQHEAVNVSKKGEKEEVLIPEKASSFKFHPGRLCQDQCYYCSGKFGLYDTPCHVGQIKSVERQQKILANEEKLTVDNCLCDACFRHVDRRANVPSYKKRLSVPGRIETVTTNTSPDDTSSEQEKTQPPKSQQTHPNGTSALTSHICAVPDCGQKAGHSLRRKGIRKSIKKKLLNFDMSTAGTYLHICEKHYEAVVQSSGCVLCKRRLGKNNMYHITTDTGRLERALADMGIPVILGQGTAVCKLCRYFANLLMKPPEHGKMQKIEFVKNYRKRLLQFYNIHEKNNTSHEEDEDEDKDKDKEKAPPKKPSTSATTSRTLTCRTRELNEAEEHADEPIEVPPSPAHSTGSSVEMISDGGIFDSCLKRSKTSSAPATVTSNSNQMELDNGVMVDYDVPMISDSSSSSSSKSTSPSPRRVKQAKDQQSKLKAILQSVGTSLEDRSDISTALRSNPNISMRELFPGEEDLGLQFKAPFGGSSSQRTPEGWTRINTFLQYDEPTRRLWEDLQKPYGNQSSFLRHLILLEKYYRNGDLILSSNASSNATVYTQTVRNRLTSFDSRGSASSSPSKEIERRSRSLSVDKIQRQLSSNSVTITARPKDAKQAQQRESESAKQTESADISGGAAATSTPNSRSILKTNLIGSKSGAVEIVPFFAGNSAPNSTSNSPHSSGGSVTPNDSSLLTKQQKILAAANKLVSNKLEASPNQKKTSLNTTPPELISLNRRPVPAHNSQQMKRPQLLPKPINSSKVIPPNVIVLPDTLTVQERLESKSWRPTLLPVTTTSHHLNNQQGPLYQTADGRRLPALVQVQSGGRPFLISIHDYNRMCILRREKLMRDQMLKGSKGKTKGTTYVPATATSSSNNKPGTSSSLQTFNKTMQAVSALENIAKKQRFISKNANFTPIAPKPTQSSTATTSSPSTVTSQTQSQPTVILPAGTLQPINLLSSSATSSLSILPNFTGQVLPLLKPSTSTATLTPAIVSGVPTNSWLWNNFPDSNQMLMNGKPKGPPPATFTSMKQQQQTLLLDNSLMSKIPKSLTVIPQHKLLPAPSGSANTTKD